MTGGELPILEVHDLTVSFGALTAVCGMSFSVERGRITSIIGPNGAGKSTLFNLISGGLRPAAGTVLFEGADVTGWEPYKLIRAGISRSFQITNLFFELPVYENLRLAAQVLESATKSLLPVRSSLRAGERVDELMEQFHLGEKANELAGYLSHGEQRRLEIAVVLACRPRLLLLDEPTQGMSHSDTQEIGKIIKQLSGDLSILLIEHDIDLVMDLSDHVVVMHQGAKLAEGTPPEVKGNPLVQSAYLGLNVHAGN